LTASRYTRAREMTGLGYGTLRNRASVARRFEMSRRRDTLTFEHYAAVRAIKDDAEQERLFDKAQTEGLSAKDLRRIRSENKSAKRTIPAEKEIKLPLTFSAKAADLPGRIQRIAEEQGLSANAWCVRILRGAVEQAEKAELRPAA
jgi:hypothetical protein